MSIKKPPAQGLAPRRHLITYRHYAYCCEALCRGRGHAHKPSYHIHFSTTFQVWKEQLCPDFICERVQLVSMKHLLCARDQPHPRERPEADVTVLTASPWAGSASERTAGPASSLPRAACSRLSMKESARPTQALTPANWHGALREPGEAPWCVIRHHLRDGTRASSHFSRWGRGDQQTPCEKKDWTGCRHHGRCPLASRDSRGSVKNFISQASSNVLKD